MVIYIKNGIEYNSAFLEILASPDGPFGPAMARTSEVLGLNPGRVGYLSPGLRYLSPGG